MPHSLVPAKESEKTRSTPDLTLEEEDWILQIEEDVLGGPKNHPEKLQLSRRQKRRNNREYIAMKEVKQAGYDGLAGINLEKFKQLQVEDPTLETSWEGVQDEASSGQEGFSQRDGLLYRHWIPPGRDGDVMFVEQLVLPMQCRESVMKIAHSVPMAGHLGRDKTVQRILQRFYWPSVHQDVARFCRTCDACQKVAHKNVAPVPLIPLPIVDVPFKRLAMDIVGPLPKSRSGKRYILLLCDYATRYPEAVALRTIDAETIAEELVKIFSRVGIPEEILTDQGSNFTSNLLAELYNMLHVHAIRTSPYHPQTDGLVERFNQTLKSMLKKSATKEGKDWDKMLPYLLFAYREVPQSSTGFSPFELLYGRCVNGPLDVLKHSWEVKDKSEESVISHILSIRDKLSKMSELAKENLSTAQKKQKQWYDQRARCRQLDVGDHVLVLLPTSSSKLLAQWQRPYTVSRRMGAVNYLVNMNDRKKSQRVFHVNMLRKYHIRRNKSVG